jgi:hypothetical protein
MGVLHDVLDDNEDVDVIWVPRRNYVEGITQEYLDKWGWTKDKLYRINWPDMQLRIYKNKPEIYWSGKVHEHLIGYSTYSEFPPDLGYLALYHEKTLKKTQIVTIMVSHIAGATCTFIGCCVIRKYGF